MDNSSPSIIVSLFYWLFVFCFIVGPGEFKSAGLTVENFFHKWLGSEELDFINYHIRRTSATVIFHSFLPLGYFIAMSFVPDSGVALQDLFNLSLDIGWHAYSSVSLFILLGAMTLVYYWHLNDWCNHPISQNLSLYVTSESGSLSAWRVPASTINIEFRRFDKYSTSPIGWSRVIVTENWLIVKTLYGLKIVPQDQATISVLETEEHDVSPESNAMVQYVRLRVKPTISRDIKPYFARILSVEFKDFKESLSTRVYTLPHIDILQSTNELFLKAFNEQIEQNPLYETLEPIDMCLGCMQSVAEVKLMKNCDSSGDGECKQCNCKPLWCKSCMGQWYASRQDQVHTETWLSGSASCPMCRAKFCMLDISIVEKV